MKDHPSRPSKWGVLIAVAVVAISIRAVTRKGTPGRGSTSASQSIPESTGAAESKRIVGAIDDPLAQGRKEREFVSAREEGEARGLAAVNAALERVNLDPGATAAYADSLRRLKVTYEAKLQASKRQLAAQSQ